MVFRTLRMLESFPKFSLKLLFFEMLVMDGCFKNSNNLFYETPMDASGWMKKDNIEKLTIVEK